MKKILSLFLLFLFTACSSNSENELAENLIELGKQASAVEFEFIPVDKADFPKIGDVFDLGGGYEMKFTKISDKPFEYVGTGESQAVMALDYKFSAQERLQDFISIIVPEEGEIVKLDPTKPELYVGEEKISLDLWKPGTYAVLDR